ncbi:MAG: dTMP kinase [Desulfovibrionaceae bacterium]|nr:dTMP kinase [Desulfovibrionaceae bacterium]
MFITVEGIEGSGKTTLLTSLDLWFQQQGRKTILTREPGSGYLGKKLRSILLNPQEQLSREAELFLFLADRAQHVADIIRPALDRGDDVLCDRFTDSTLAYQGLGRQFFNEQWLRQCNNIASLAIRPDLTLLLDMDPGQALERARSRNMRAGIAEAEGRFEAESIEFHRRIREGFRKIAQMEPERIIMFDASLSPQDLLTLAISIISARLKG